MSSSKTDLFTKTTIKVLPECGQVKIENFSQSAAPVDTAQQFLSDSNTNSTNTTTLSANTSECGSSSNGSYSPNLFISSPGIETAQQQLAENDTQSEFLTYQLILSFDFIRIYVCIVGLPIVAIVSVFGIGLVVHRQQLFNYEWNGCGNTLLPSVSRVINLPAERIVWNFFILMHISFWPLCLVQIYLNHRRKIYSELNNNKLLTFGAELTLLSGFTELAFVVLLSVVGERENPALHVVFFVGFFLSCALNFLLISIYSTKDRAVRFALTAVLYILGLVISISFLLNLNYCTKHSYTVFASSEYATVLVVFGFHANVFRGLRSCNYCVVKEKRVK